MCCSFCGEEIDKEKEEKTRAEYRRRILNVTTLEFKDTILQKCEARKDVQGHMLEKHLANILDLVAEEATYHEDCRKKFITSLPAVHSSSGRPVSSDLDETMAKIYEIMPESEDCQFSFEELKPLVCSKYSF